MHDVEKVYDVFVTQFPQQGYLSDRSRRDAFVAVFNLYLLQSNNLNY